MWEAVLLRSDPTDQTSHRGKAYHRACLVPSIRDQPRCCVAHHPHRHRLWLLREGAEAAGTYLNCEEVQEEEVMNDPVDPTPNQVAELRDKLEDMMQEYRHDVDRYLE